MSSMWRSSPLESARCPTGENLCVGRSEVGMTAPVQPTSSQPHLSGEASMWAVATRPSLLASGDLPCVTKHNVVVILGFAGKAWAGKVRAPAYLRRRMHSDGSVFATADGCAAACTAVRSHRRRAVIRKRSWSSAWRVGGAWGLTLGPIALGISVSVWCNARYSPPGCGLAHR